VTSGLGKVLYQSNSIEIVEVAVARPVLLRACTRASGGVAWQHRGIARKGALQ